MKVKDWITREVITITPSMPAKQAFAKMKALGIRHLVVADEGRTLGIVTDRDLRRPQVADVFKSWDQVYRLSDEFEVEDLMTSPVITVNEHTDIREAAKLLVEHRIGALPVLDTRQHVVGIITETDVLRAFISGW